MDLILLLPVLLIAGLLISFFLIGLSKSPTGLPPLPEPKKQPSYEEFLLSIPTHSRESSELKEELHKALLRKQLKFYQDQ